MQKPGQKMKVTLKICTLLSLSLSTLSALGGCASLKGEQAKRNTMGQSKDAPQTEEVAVDELQAMAPSRSKQVLKKEYAPSEAQPTDRERTDTDDSKPVSHQTEDYSRIYENAFLNTLKNPLSTFSIDVDTASYSNTRRFIEKQNQLPPADAVRIEELVNYFPYDYPQPEGQHPFSVSTDLAECPWTPGHKLLRIGLKGKEVSLAKTPPANLVFLLDVSGSMDEPNKLPLLKRSLKMIVDQLREEDHVSIVVYAGAAGTALPPTSGSHKETILAALDQLQAGGSTAGSAGIQLAYETALKNFRKDGNNRVILATDGDFNVGPSSDSELTRMIEAKRKEGIYLTVLGFGMGNYKDNKMEQMADKGNGNYAYIDSLLEARKVMVTEMGATLVTIAKDVKLQLEFNPTKVKEYRLIGYENRILAAEDFDDDTKDAGEMGAGTTVTALYELIPADGKGSGHDLKYQQSTVTDTAQHSDEILTVKLRYKPLQSDQSILLSKTVKDQSINWSKVPQDFRFAAAVASFGMNLRASKYAGSWGLEDVIAQAQQGLGQDKEGYRHNFVNLAKQAQLLQKTE